jgi:hypothetical protein
MTFNNAWSDNLKQKRQIIQTGIIGLLAASLVGAGEFLLHFDILGRFSESGSYNFMLGISVERSTLGHFIGVLSAPLYIIGFWHVMKMLEPANRLLSRITFLVMSYGIIIGVVWIGSRSSISMLVNNFSTGDIQSLISIYELRYENLLQVTRVAALIFSVIYTYLILTGRSHYPRWMALFNPLLLILMSFSIWMIAPIIGVYIMPIALNIAFFILFILSIFHSLKIKE